MFLRNCGSLAGDFRLINAEFLHAGTEGVMMYSECLCGTTGAGDLPPGLIKYSEDMFPFYFGNPLSVDCLGVIYLGDCKRFR